MRNQYNTYNGYMPQYAQRQSQIDRQKQELHYSYCTLMQLLSSAENFAGLSEEQYGGYNISIAKKYEDLKSEFAWELYCFKKSMQLYIKKYGHYPYPIDLPKGKILNDIKRYIDHTPNHKEKKIYYAMMDLINGKNIDIDFDQLFDELDEDSNRKFDPKKIKDYIGPINNILNDIENNADKEFEIKKNKTKPLKKLVKHSQINSNTYLYVMIGKKGKLSRENNTNCFTFRNNSTKKTIFLKPPFKEGKKLYECQESSTSKEYIYLSRERCGNDFVCVYFDGEPQKIPENNFFFIDKENNYGILKNNNVNEKKEVLVVNYEDLK